jgi:enoyl-CoA hydratase/carnithine racemase
MPFSSSTPGGTGEVLLERVKGKLAITLNRTKALNALNLPMIETILEALKVDFFGVFFNYSQFLQTPSQLVLIKGQGPKAFCAGGDVVGVAI